mgnify:CR=1 FL=1
MRSASSQPRPEKVGCVTFGDKRIFASRTRRPLSSRLETWTRPTRNDRSKLSRDKRWASRNAGITRSTQAVGHGERRAIAAEHKRHFDASVHVDDRSDTGHADGVDLLVGARFDRLRRADHIGDDDPPVTWNLGVPGGLDGLGKGLQHRKIAVEIDRRHERVGRVAVTPNQPGAGLRGWALSGLVAFSWPRTQDSDQTKVEFNLSSDGGQDESRVNAEKPDGSTKDQETSRWRSQAGQTAGEAGIGRAGREEGKGEEGKSEERKGRDGKGEKVKPTKEELGRQDAKKSSAGAGKKARH